MVITISIPDNAKCLLKENQKVDIGTPYLEKRSESRAEVAVAKRLDIDPSKIFHYLKKLVGEKIKKGETLALKKGFFTTVRIKSDYDGVIQEINHNDGVLVITTEEGDSKTHNAFFKGKVKKIEDNEIKLEVEEMKEFHLSNATDNFGGETFFLNGSPDSLTSTDVSGKVLIAESISNFAQIKAEALGTLGFVTLNKIEEKNEDVHYAQLKNIADKDKIKKVHLPYCAIDKKNSRIILYK